MGADPLINRLNGQIIDQDAINLINRVLQGDFIGRDSSGSPTAGQNLGTPSVPWGTARLTNLILGGVPVDPGLFGSIANRIASGAVRATSDFPDYLKPAGGGGGASFTLLAAITPLTFDVNGVDSQFTTDEVKGSLTVAPSSNNTCLINDVGLTGQDTTKNLGENDTVIPVDNMGTELTGKIGKFVALLSQVTGEIMYCKIESATQLIKAKRGFFFNSSGNPIQRAVLTNNDTLQILSLGFIFIDKNGTTIDVTFTNPVIDGNQPSSPATGDYWLDTAANVWKRFSGSTFDQIDRTFAGYVVINTADAIGTRPEYFTKSFSDENTLTVDLITDDQIRAHQAEFLISVDGKFILFDFSFFDWIAATDFESGVSRTISTDYWLYISEDGKPFISDKKPYDNLGFLKGWYHPYESWRAVGQVFNNASNEFELVNASDKTLITLDGVILSTGRIIISNNVSDATNDIDFSGGLFIYDDGTGQAVAPVFTKKIDIVWLPGNNKGGRVGALADTTYFCFAIHDIAEGSRDYIIADSFTPLLPAGYTKKEYLGSIVRDAGIIRPFTQADKYFYYKTEIESFTGAFGLTATIFALDTPVGIPTIGLINVHFNITATVATSKLGRFSNPDAIDDTVTTVNAQIVATRDLNNVNITMSAAIEVLTDTSAQIRGRSNNAVASADVVGTRGWIDINLRG